MKIYHAITIRIVWNNLFPLKNYEVNENNFFLMDAMLWTLPYNACLKATEESVQNLNFEESKADIKEPELDYHSRFNSPNR